MRQSQSRYEYELGEILARFKVRPSKVSGSSMSLRLTLYTAAAVVASIASMAIR